MIALDAAGVLPDFECTRTFRMTSIVLLLWWIAFTYPALSVPDGNVNLALIHAAETTEQGSPYNQMVILSFCALGLYFFRHALSFFRSRQGQFLALLLALYCGWSLCSTLWSEHPDLTVRRLISFFCLVLGTFGLGAGFYGRAGNGVTVLARHVVIAAAVSMAMLLCFQFDVLLSFLDPKTSFKDTAKITNFAYPAVFAMLASFFPVERPKILRFGSAAAFFLIVIVMKGRSIIGDGAAGFFLLYSRLTTDRLSRLLLFLSGCLLTIILADLSTGGNLMLQIFAILKNTVYDWMSYLTLGQRENNITSLSGRMPLWKAIYPYIAAQPFEGYGFGAFWDPTRFDEMYAAAKWRATAAHNGYLDELLATGAVGLGALLSFWFSAMVLCVRSARGKSGNELRGHLVFVWLLAFLLFNGTESILQNFFQFPMIACLIGVFTVFTPRPESPLEEIREMLFERGFVIEEMAR